MRETCHELVVGETLLIGDRLLTIVEIEPDAVTFRIEKIEAAGDPDQALEPWQDASEFFPAEKIPTGEQPLWGFPSGLLEAARYEPVEIDPVAEDRRQRPR